MPKPRCWCSGPEHVKSGLHRSGLTPETAELVYQALKEQEYLDEQQKVLAQRCCQRAYVRGAFLSHGSITNPEKNYHLEIFTEKSEVAEKVYLTINALGLEAKMTARKGI